MSVVLSLGARGDIMCRDQCVIARVCFSYRGKFLFLLLCELLTFSDVGGLGCVICVRPEMYRRSRLEQ